MTSPVAQRWGITIPPPGMTQSAQTDLIRSLPDWGYTDAWSSETNATDAFTPLALASVWQPTLRLGTAIVSAYTRGPGLIAMSAAAMAAAAPGRFVLGLGASSPVIAQNWNGMMYEAPYRRVRDVLRVVRIALAGERVDARFDSFTIRRFKLENAPAVPPPVMLAGLRPQMLRLAGQEADGAILNWLSAADVPRCREAIDNDKIETVARIFVCPTEDQAAARSLGRRAITSYLTVPAYAAFHDWLGRGEALRPMHEAWAAGLRKDAAAAIPDHVVDELVLHGSPSSVVKQVEAYVTAGVTTPVINLLPTPDMDTAGVIAQLGTQLR